MRAIERHAEDRNLRSRGAGESRSGSNAGKRPHVVTFTSSSTVKNFAALLDRRKQAPFAATLTASIGPVTSATLRELGFPVDIAATEFTVPGLVSAISEVFRDKG